jgi:hypothetical protein
MIKESHLVPGKVLAMLSVREMIAVDTATGSIMHREERKVWVPCMVVSYVPIIHRRHSRARAPRDCGWDVLVFWLDDRYNRLEKVHIAPDGREDGIVKWKSLW